MDHRLILYYVGLILYCFKEITKWSIKRTNFMWIVKGYLTICFSVTSLLLVYINIDLFKSLCTINKILEEHLLCLFSLMFILLNYCYCLLTFRWPNYSCILFTTILILKGAILKEILIIHIHLHCQTCIEFFLFNRIIVVVSNYVGSGKKYYHANINKLQTQAQTITST